MKRIPANYIIYLILSLLSVCSLASCSDDFIKPEESETVGPMDGYLTIQLTCAGIRTRAMTGTEAGITDLNENLIKTVTLCMWPKGGDWTDTRPPYYMKTFENVDMDGEYVIRMPLTDELISNLFNSDSSRSCNVFAAVNVDPGDAATPAELRAMAISSGFAEMQVQDSFAMDGGGVAYMMNLTGVPSAMVKIDLQRSAAKVDLHIDVTQEVKEVLDNGNEVTWIPDLSAMYVMLNNGVKESNLDPSLSDIPNEFYFNTPADLQYRLFKPASAAQQHALHDDGYPYEQEIPFYTYPNEWDSSDPDSPGRSFMTLRIPWSNDGGASFKTCYYRVPVVTPEVDELVRNTSYHVLLKVSVLGSFVPDEPMPLENLSYKAAEWGLEGFDVDIVEPRYLVVDQNEFDINNVEEISIPFYTSHKTVVTDIQMTFYRFNYSDEGSKFPVTCTKEMNTLSATASRAGEPVFEYDFDNNTNVLTVSHPLVIYEPMKGQNTTKKVIDLTNGDGPNSTRTKVVLEQEIISKLTPEIKWFRKYVNAAGKTEAEYSKVEFVVTVQHEDMIGTDLFKETVHINQYPGMYIDAISNQYNYNASANSISGSGATGGVFINDNNTGLTLDYVLGGGKNGYTTSIGLSSTDYLNWNPNMYLITITRLPEDTQFIIADPRATEINNMLNDESMGTKNTTPWPTETIGFSQVGARSRASIVPGTERKIKWYYPTREEKAAENLISPKFRICSSYAGTGNILNRTLARRRAASYQENGYPAGRWRLPTFAEVRFIIRLSEELKIPRLFGRGGLTEWSYWCANGKVNVPGKGSTDKATYTSLGASAAENNDNERTRFVYDEWYWGPETVDRNTFIWGDVEKK